MAKALLFEVFYEGGVDYLCDTPLPLVGVPVARDNQYRTYFPLIMESSNVSSRFDSVIEIGDIVVANDGSLDHWWSANFQNKEVVCYIGEETDTRDNFEVAFISKNGGITSSEDGIFNVDLIDGKYTVNKPDMFLEKELGVAFGNLYNVPCESVNAAIQQYRISQTDASTVDAKDRGNTGLSESGNSASFTLPVTPSGVITADVTSTTNTASLIISAVCSLAGISVNAASLALLPTYTMGVHYSKPPTGGDILNQVMTSIGGSWNINANGEIIAFVNDSPTGSAVLELTDFDIQLGGLSIISEQPSYKEVILNYKKNYKTMSQQELVSFSVIGSEFQELQKEYRQVSSTADASAESTLEINSLIDNQTDAQIEADRLASFRSQTRYIWSVTVLNKGQTLQIGDTISINSTRAGAVFSSTKLVNVVSISKTLTSNEIKLEVWF